MSSEHAVVTYTIVCVTQSTPDCASSGKEKQCSPASDQHLARATVTPKSWRKRAGVGAQFSRPWAKAFLSIILTSMLLSARRNKKMSKGPQGAELEAESLSVHQGITGHAPFVPTVPSDLLTC